MGVIILNGGRPTPPPVKDVALLGPRAKFFDPAANQTKFCGLSYPMPQYDPKAVGELSYEEEATGKTLVYSQRQCKHCGQYVAVVKGSRQGWCIKCDGWICGAHRCDGHIDGLHPHERVRR